MPNVLTIKNVSPMMKIRKIRYQVALSGAYVQAVRGSNVGEVLNLGNYVGKFDPEQGWGLDGPSVGSGKVTNPPAGYPAKIIPGADSQHWLLQIFSAAGVELAAGAYPAGILADVDIYIEFEGGNFK